MFNPSLFYDKLKNLSHHARVKTYASVFDKNASYPLISVSYGSTNKPTLLVTGGVHGLERIGAQVALSLLDVFENRLQWDKHLEQLLQHIQVVFVPMVNPVGLKNFTRANGNGVDLMRNAPVTATDKVPFLAGGHLLSPKIPWYRGKTIQTETQFVCDVVKDILDQTNTLISLDCHSGFGTQDQLWFPFATTKNHFTHINEIFSLLDIFEKTYPNHFYKIEPQSINYLNHGDIWDYAFFNLKKAHQVFLPFTLEMGSWSWVKKNPFQILNKNGLHNPVKPHRTRRALRRHVTLFDFLIHALASTEVWNNDKIKTSFAINQKAVSKYYNGK